VLAANLAADYAELRMTERVVLIPSKDAQGQFQPTRWSVVLAARNRRTPEGEAALEWLCERYWRPLHALMKAKGLSTEDAEDMVQGFFEQAVRGGLMAGADASRGRFRSYLLGCLGHYWTDQLRRQGAVKRGGGTIILSLQGPCAESCPGSQIPDGRTPDQEYDRAWARSIVEGVIVRLEKECDADGHTGRFAVLRVFVDGDRGEVLLSTAAAELGLSLAALKSMVHRLRRRMREMIREEIRETVETEAEVDAELQELFRALKTESFR
jgi:DNA-directed RNA polymerase specialized sigma24 family protein